MISIHNYSDSELFYSLLEEREGGGEGVRGGGSSKLGKSSACLFKII